MAPKGTPASVVQLIHQSVVATLQDPSTRSALLAQGVQGEAMPPADLAKLIADDTRQWEQVIQASKIVIE